MGRALCVMLVEAGCTVAACDIDMAALQGTVAACEAAQPGCTVMIFRCDISDEEACISFSEAVASELGTSHINALFNNTGIGIRRMMNFAFKLMDFALKMMNFVFKMMDFGRWRRDFREELRAGPHCLARDLRYQLVWCVLHITA